MTRIRFTLLCAAVLLLGSALAGVAQPRLGRAADAQGDETPEKTITATGSGTITVVPDRSAFAFTVESRAETARAALANTAALANAVVAAAKNTGVGPAAIQTSQVSLTPLSGQVSPPDQPKPSGTADTGYAAATTVLVRTSIRDASAVVDAAVAAGATGVSGPSLWPSDRRGPYALALKKAVADAHDKAAVLADATGLTLHGVRPSSRAAQPRPSPPRNAPTRQPASRPNRAATRSTPPSPSPTAHNRLRG
jgi:uncharacterized protein YggE